MNNVVVDFDACTGCKTCYLACFADVIRWDAEAKRPDHRVPRGLRALQPL